MKLKKANHSKISDKFQLRDKPNFLEMGLALFVSIVIIAQIRISLLLVPFSDDYCSMAAVKMSGVAGATLNWYQTWSGSLTSIAIYQFSLLPFADGIFEYGHIIFFTIQTILAVASFYLLNKFAFPRAKNRISFLLACLWVVLIPVMVGETGALQPDRSIDSLLVSVFPAASVAHLLPFYLGLLSLLLVFTSAKFKTQLIGYILLIATSMMGLAESAVWLGFLMSIPIILQLMRKKFSFNREMLIKNTISLTIYIFGFSLSIFAPGNFARKASSLNEITGNRGEQFIRLRDSISKQILFTFDYQAVVSVMLIALLYWYCCGGVKNLKKLELIAISSTTVWAISVVCMAIGDALSYYSGWHYWFTFMARNLMLFSLTILFFEKFLRNRNSKNIFIPFLLAYTILTTAFFTYMTMSENYEKTFERKSTFTQSGIPAQSRDASPNPLLKNGKTVLFDLETDWVKACYNQWIKTS